MRYSDGNDARVGDRVQIDGQFRGIVVASIDTGHYSSAFPEAEWSYLKEGILIDTEFAGVVHYRDSTDETIVLVGRA